MGTAGFSKGQLGLSGPIAKCRFSDEVVGELEDICGGDFMSRTSIGPLSEDVGAETWGGD